MAIITKITVQKNKSDRYNIFMDDGTGEKYAFSVDEDVLIKFQLKKGIELDPFALTEISYQDDIRKAYNLAVQFLARRIRSEHEVREYLLKKEIDEPIIQEAIHKLYEYQFLNDEEYAKAYVRTTMNTTDKGSVLTKRELKDKGISESNIRIALKEYDFEHEYEKAKILSEKFCQKNNKDSLRMIQQKLEQLLMRKGYQTEIITRVLNEYKVENDEAVNLQAIRIQGEKALRKFSKYSGYEFQQKMKQALFRKGFSLDMIEEYLQEVKANHES
ncbi:recombination regulator RecX [Bacillus massilinigeriensis]|uniref:recombination regulator RecX n=1 Tax=Bacillus massilionigeriensis TaxID=1805475 RepID=UPI00096B554E